MKAQVHAQFPRATQKALAEPLRRVAFPTLAVADDPSATLSPSAMALLVAATRPLGPPMPYVWLTPNSGGGGAGGSGTRAVRIEVQERAWPPAHAYTVGCWVRRPVFPAASASSLHAASAAVSVGEDEPFALFELETSDERSYTAAFLRVVDETTAELTVQAGSSKRLSRCRVELPFAHGVWHWLCIVHKLHILRSTYVLGPGTAACFSPIMKCAGRND